jgi:hypothetical protein
MEESKVLGKHGMEDNDDVEQKDTIGKQKLDLNMDNKLLPDMEGDEMMAIEEGEFFDAA